MEKKPNMSNVDELCIKYVFDELDPSEVTLVEQAMINDQNLLIEGESLKSTWKKLRNLPELTPPPNISEAIMDQARDYSSQQQFFGNSWNNPGLLATAAIVLFSLLISTAYLLPSDVITSESEGDQTMAATSAQVPASFHSKDTYEELFSVWNGKSNMVFVGNEEHGAGSAPADSLLKESAMPVNTETPQTILSPVFRDFHLTGNRY